MLSKNQIHIKIYNKLGLLKKAKNASWGEAFKGVCCLFANHASIKYATKIKIKASTPPPPNKMLKTITWLLSL